MLSTLAAFTTIVGASDLYLKSSCLGLEDGSHWLKLLEDGDAVHQRCDNEFMVIDVNEDPNVQDYFSTFTNWHYAISGPEMMDHGNWENWWRPSQEYIDDGIGGNFAKDYFQFAISPDCSSCSVSNNVEDNVYSLFNDDETGERTAYYMTGTLFGCLAKHKALKDCRWDYDSMTCGYCTQTDSHSDMDYAIAFPGEDNWDKYISHYQSLGTNATWMDLQMSLCGVTPTASYSSMVPTTHDDCNTFQDNVKPSIGTNGEFCVCVKPHDDYDADTSYAVTDSELKEVQANYDAYHTKLEELSSVDDQYELFQSDFETGTYRITKSGTYTIMEDITFDFNAGDLDSPNEAGWWPTSDQVDDYPGAGQKRDNYYLGFIAGITVETDDVVINLNGYTLAMSDALYYQQRFFSIIALKSVAFPLNQGPGFFGMEPVYANNVVIKDGTLGLSSHHGIHGHYNKDVTITNVHIRDFETHGVQMSYFENLVMRDVEIGPSSTKAYLKGEYAYARWTLVQLERIRDSGEYNDIFPVTFNGQTHKVFKDFIDTLRTEMDMAFKYVMGIETYSINDESWQSAKSLYINEDGIPYGAVMYGMFLNLWFANVFTIHPSTKYSTTAVLENINIHDLTHKMMEYNRLDAPQQAMYRNQFNAPLDANALLGDQIEAGYDDIDWESVEYMGSTLTDAEILLSMVTNDWEELGLVFMENDFDEWAQGSTTVWSNDVDTAHPYIGCNVDRMGHVPKGIIGIRMDGVEDVTFDGLTITDLHEQSLKGSELCGEYWDGASKGFTRFFGQGNTLQNEPYLYGYTGNYLHGIFSDFAEYKLSGEVEISNLISDTGLVRAVGMYRGTELSFGDDSSLVIADLSAGHELYGEDTDALSEPYNPSIAKPFHVLWSSSETMMVDGEEVETEFTSSIVGVPAQLTMHCMYGRDGMEGDSDWVTLVSNAVCSTMDDSMHLAADIAEKRATLDKYLEHGFPEVKKTRKSPHQRLSWSALQWLAISAFVCVVVVYTLKQGSSKLKAMKSAPTEIEPLMATH